MRGGRRSEAAGAFLDQQVHNRVQLAALTAQGNAQLLHPPQRQGRLERSVERYLAKPETNRVWYCGTDLQHVGGCGPSRRPAVDRGPA
jgi:hypothetical protein